MSSPIEIYYWPNIPGRADFIRLVLEDSNYPYIDITRGDEKEGKGMPAMMKILEGEGIDTPPFAAPFIKDGDLIIGQTANILSYLSPRLGLSPKDEISKLWANQLMLTILDMVEQVHSTHHPVEYGNWYKDQIPEAIRNSHYFCTQRLPKFFGYFEKVISKTESPFLVGDSITYVDIALFYVLQGVQFAFPKACAKHLKNTPKILSLYDLVGARPNIKKYLESDRRIAFKEGIFRHETALDHVE